MLRFGSERSVLPSMGCPVSGRGLIGEIWESVRHFLCLLIAEPKFHDLLLSVPGGARFPQSFPAAPYPVELSAVSVNAPVRVSAGLCRRWYNFKGVSACGSLRACCCVCEP